MSKIQCNKCNGNIFEVWLRGQGEIEREGDTLIINDMLIEPSTCFCVNCRRLIFNAERIDNKWMMDYKLSQKELEKLLEDKNVYKILEERGLNGLD